MNRPPIVVVDDNRDAADSLVELLRVLGYDAIPAYSGPQALAACRQVRPALAILDVQMPIMNGVEVARAIRSELQPAPVLASFTGLNGSAGLAGDGWTDFDAHLSKPIEVSELAQLLSRTFRAASAGATAAVPSAEIAPAASARA